MLHLLVVVSGSSCSLGLFRIVQATRTLFQQELLAGLSDDTQIRRVKK